MAPKSKTPGSENTDPQSETAPLKTLAQIIADWIEVHGVDSLAKGRTGGGKDPSDDANSSG